MHAALTAVTAVHHTGTAFGPGLFPFLVWTDVGLTVVETIWHFGLSFSINGLIIPIWNGTFLHDPLVALVSVGGVVLALSLLVLLALKILSIIDAWETAPMLKRVDVALCGAAHPWWRYPASAIFGVKLWEARIPGEPKVLSILRGFLALLAILALVVFGWYQAVVSPVSESGRTFHREYYIGGTKDISYRIEDTLYTARGKLVLVWFIHPEATPHIADAVTASARWYSSIGCSVERESPPRFYPIDFRGNSPYEVASVACTIPEDTLPNSQQWFPNFDLQVNFTGLFGSAKPGSTYNRDFDAVRVYVGLTNDTSEIVQNTRPILLFPGTNLLSVFRPVFRETIQREGLTVLGFESLTTSLVALIEETIPNPFMGPPENRNISTLGLTHHSIPIERYGVQDYRTKAVVDGLSSIGGLGSLLSTALAMLLGTSLYTALFREKPQSPFGLLHSIGPSQKMMADACDQKYPRLCRDMQSEKEDAGVMSLLLDTLIDIDDLRDQP